MRCRELSLGVEWRFEGSVQQPDTQCEQCSGPGLATYKITHIHVVLQFHGLTEEHAELLYQSCHV